MIARSSAPRIAADTVIAPSKSRTAIASYVPIALVLGLFGAAAFVVPTMAPVAVGDDWVYTLSVEKLVRNGNLEILDLSVVTLLFQVAWGSLFALIAGPSFGVLRVSTVVINFFGGWACYGIARELGVDRAKSALAAAAYLFNPLSFVLSYTFMTDPHFTAVMTIATFGYVRGLRSEEVDRGALWLGAVFAACAFLVRQQGALIPAAVVAAMVVQGRLRLDRASLILFLRIVAIPVAAFILYYIWIFFLHGLPEQQAAFTDQVTEAGLEASALLVIRMTFGEAMYAGLFVLPILAGAAGALATIARRTRPVVWLFAGAWGLMLIAGILHFDAFGFEPPPMPRMPYFPQYLGPSGLGPGDLVGQRPWLVSWQFLDLLTAICALASLGFALLVARRLLARDTANPTRGSAGILLVVLLGQVAGAWPPSFHFRDWILSVDRYLLPLLPLVVCLAAWAIRGLPWSHTGAWLIVAIFAVISVAGTRDFLVFQQNTWHLASTAYASGAPLTAIDGGAAWDGYYLYEYSIANDIDQQTPSGPWWTDLFGPATTSDYIVASTPVEGYAVVQQVTVPSWLSGLHPTLYLLERKELPPLP